MPPLVNRQWEQFCVEYFGGKTKQDAAIAAGYTPRSAGVAASRLLRIDKVSDRLEELQQAVANAKIADVRERKETLTEQVRGRMAHYVVVGPDGGILSKLTPETLASAAVKKIETAIVKPKKGPPKVVITKVELNDQKGAIAELNKMDGDYAPAKVEHGGEGGKPIIIKVVYDDSDKE